MPYLIDGHNLIPHTGLRLEDPNDEAKLTAMLLRYFARSGQSGTVYFDGQAPGAPAGGSSRHLTVRFVAPPRTADDAIRAHLDRLGAGARNWAVVSNDQAVRRAATQAGARPIASGEFARSLRSAASPAADEKPEGGLTPEEIAEFERLFRDRSS
jgi:predicted RNA-binding protein with PIN domain